MGKLLRERIVNELTQKYKDTENCVFLNFSGLNVDAMSQLRSQLQELGVEFFVVKNSLLKIALDKVGLPFAENLFLKPTATVTGGEDPVAVCKLIVDFHKKSKTTEIKGGLLDRKLLSEKQVIELSKLPSRPALLSQILGLFTMPLTDIASLLNNTMAQFANLVQNHIEKLEEKG